MFAVLVECFNDVCDVVVAESVLVFAFHVFEFAVNEQDFVAAVCEEG